MKIVFLMEFLDQSFLDVQEAKTFFEIPLLGAISKITTAESIAEEQQKQKWIIFWMCSGGALCIVLTVIMGVFLK